ncbi:2-hydroxychromene-2-carboxylate isomerase [Alteromonas sp. a30]|uniref:2-hydroxychromene-2-carboxylate isomerase n=1 Tax=Alteromonas sp. a30 TaxID=2730917 RepID=UPI002280401C|nr:2-hydroxychromene-2-carboxylate isomerase [Alteromonas sp. a30]MCY7294855.1 2-hydroxychromene-2-carboxylate isomerase [Alteromonas sp. a30]
MSKPTLEFWYEFSSPYCYLTAKRIAELANEKGFVVDWKPFLLGAVFKAENRDAPVSIPAKAKYMRRDMLRKSKNLGYPYKWPDTFPTFALVPARIGTAIHGEPWEADFIKGIFELYFEQGVDISGKDPAPIQALLERLGAPVAEIFAKLEQAEFKDALKQNTDKAIEIGIFGAPMFFAKGEMFWGDESLEEAVDHLLND